MLVDSFCASLRCRRGFRSAAVGHRIGESRGCGNRRAVLSMAKGGRKMGERWREMEEEERGGREIFEGTSSLKMSHALLAQC